MCITEENIRGKIKTTLQLGNMPGTLAQISLKGKKATINETHH